MRRSAGPAPACEACTSCTDRSAETLEREKGFSPIFRENTPRSLRNFVTSETAESTPFQLPKLFSEMDCKYKDSGQTFSYSTFPNFYGFYSRQVRSNTRHVIISVTNIEKLGCKILSRYTCSKAEWWNRSWCSIQFQNTCIWNNWHPIKFNQIVTQISHPVLTGSSRNTITAITKLSTKNSGTISYDMLQYNGLNCSTITAEIKIKHGGHRNTY